VRVGIADVVVLGPRAGSGVPWLSIVRMVEGAEGTKGAAAALRLEAGVEAESEAEEVELVDILKVERSAALINNGVGEGGERGLFEGLDWKA
jgi:hypothetical protein